MILLQLGISHHMILTSRYCWGDTDISVNSLVHTAQVGYMTSGHTMDLSILEDTCSLHPPGHSWLHSHIDTVVGIPDHSDHTDTALDTTIYRQCMHHK